MKDLILETKIKKTLKNMGKSEHLMDGIIDICSECYINKSSVDNEYEKSKFTIIALNELVKLGFSKKEANQIFKDTMQDFKSVSG